MLVRVSCRTCHIDSLWTDDPGTFLASVCLRRRRCRAALTEEGSLERREKPQRTLEPRVSGTRRTPAVG
jgi:hypothetical protein